MTTPLMYGSKEMNPEPTNAPSLAYLAAELVGSRPVVVELEPGDATRYILLIVPVWAKGVGRSLSAFGIRTEHADQYLIVVKLHDTGGLACYATRDVGTWDLETIPNEWTRTFLVWWLRLLWKEIDT